MFYFIFYPFVFVLLRTVIKFFGRLETIGAHNVPAKGPVLYCPNHLSDADPPTVFVSAPRRAWYIGKKELFTHWFWGWFFKEFRGIPIKRDSPDRAALRVAEEKLAQGYPVVMFPEGRCSQKGTLQKLQPGAAMVALRTNATVIPVGIQRTNVILPYGGSKPHFSPKPVRIEYGAPIFPSEFKDMKHSDAVAALTNRIGHDLARMTNQPAPPDLERGSRRSAEKSIQSN